MFRLRLDFDVTLVVVQPTGKQCNSQTEFSQRHLGLALLRNRPAGLGPESGGQNAGPGQSLLVNTSSEFLCHLSNYQLLNKDCSCYRSVHSGAYASAILVPRPIHRRAQDKKLHLKANFRQTQKTRDRFQFRSSKNERRPQPSSLGLALKRAILLPVRFQILKAKINCCSLADSDRRFGQSYWTHPSW